MACTPRQVILPFTVAVVNIVAHAYDLDPLMVFMGLTETVRRPLSLPCSLPPSPLPDSSPARSALTPLPPRRATPCPATQTPFRTIGIREPYVRKLLFGRALWVTLLSSAVVAVLTVLFWAVPGHRL